jgi:hypothetical protein
MSSLQTLKALSGDELYKYYRSGGVTETSKVVDVMLLLGGKQHSYARGHMLCLHYTLCLMQLSVIRNLILVEFSD